MIGSLYIARDVTARKQAEVALKKAHDQLEIRVRERTAELAARNEELKHEITERKSAEKAVQSRLLALTSPGRIPDRISYTDLFTVQELQTIQNAFANATNVASIITDPDGRPITQPSNFCRLCQDIIRPSKKGGANCMRSDALIGRPNPLRSDHAALPERRVMGRRGQHLRGGPAYRQLAGRTDPGRFHDQRSDHQIRQGNRHGRG